MALFPIGVPAPDVLAPNLLLVYNELISSNFSPLLVYWLQILQWLCFFFLCPLIGLQLIVGCNIHNLRI